ncbi:1050_t:CDS:2 [Scutellospora calospora]|uniref:1050_t:CDS:1 n=1 Tax=Scutellospora calospora TaxID=85575 RepID=A0ACA9KCS1_9GLOM|nr:1050_t:CDS:2 [Scutellospora calospora]
MSSQIEPDNSSSNQYETPLCRDQKTPKKGEYKKILKTHYLFRYYGLCTKGVFHSGVEVFDKEYNFGGHDFDATGVFLMKPRTGPPNVTFKDSIFMGYTSMTKEDVKNAINELSKEWSGNSYNLNCNHFSSELCKILVGKPAPNWINRAAKLGTLFPCRLNINKYICVVPRFIFFFILDFLMESSINKFNKYMVKTPGIWNNTWLMNTLDKHFNKQTRVVPNDWIEAPEGVDSENGLIIATDPVKNEESIQES